jgi:hypothetical protein
VELEPSATTIALIHAATPVVITVRGVKLLHERMSGAQRVAVLAALAGVLFVIARGDIGNLLAVRFSAGDGWIVAAAVLPGVLSCGAYSFPQREPGAARNALMLYLAPVYGALPAWLASRGGRCVDPAEHLAGDARRICHTLRRQAAHAAVALCPHRPSARRRCARADLVRAHWHGSPPVARIPEAGVRIDRCAWSRRLGEAPGGSAARHPMPNGWKRRQVGCAHPDMARAAHATGPPAFHSITRSAEVRLLTFGGR